MASKNLGAVIQRAISDGAFRRQLQSDPAAALRGFNLTSDEVAAIRSGDSGKLMSLGVDQRMSKAFSVAGNLLGGSPMRASVTDLHAGAESNAMANDQTAGTRDSIASAPNSGAREEISTGNTSGVRAINDNPPADGTRSAETTGTVSGVRAVHDSPPADLRSTETTGTVSGVRAIHDNAPADSLRAAASTGDASGVRAIHDNPPAEGHVSVDDNVAAANAGRGGSLAGDMSGDSARSIHDVAPFGDGTLASHMADPGDASSIHSIVDNAPFEGNVNAASIGGDQLLGGDAHVDPGVDSSHGFVPSDSADVQREMLDGGDHGNALGNTGETTNEHGWG